MPLEILRPNALVGAGSWGTGTLPGAINDQNDSSLVTISDQDDEFQVGFPNLPPQAHRIVSFNAYYRYNREGAWAGQIRQFVDVSGSKTYSSYRTPAVDPSVTESGDSLGNPLGGSWSPENVNAATGGCGSTSGNAGVTGRVTEMRWEVEWAAAPYGFVYTLLPWLGPLYGVTLEEMPGLACWLACASRGALMVLPHEYSAVVADLRGPRPVFAI
jgi:hypothetical protein